MPHLPTRRDALRTATAAGLFAALPANLARAMMAGAVEQPKADGVRVGCIGVAGQGTQGAGNMKQVIKNVVALCDVDKGRLADAQKVLEKATKPGELFGDFRKLLDRKDVDAVLIATPDHWHAVQTIMACQAGKDVYVEKPMTLNVREGRAVSDAAKKYKRVVQTGSQQRSDAKFRHACELVRNGKLGTLKGIQVGVPKSNFKGPAVADGPVPADLDYDLWVGPSPMRPYNAKRVHYNFRFFWDTAGGQMANWGAHHLDIVQWALGMDAAGPTKISGTAKYAADGSYEVPESFEVAFTYPTGLVVKCGQSHKGGVTFEGDRGSLFVTRGTISSTPGDLATQKIGGSDVRLYDSPKHFGNWLDCIKSRKAPICDAEVGHRSATVCHLGNICLRVGRPITWDAAGEQIVGDAEAAKLLGRVNRSPWTLPA